MSAEAEQKGGRPVVAGDMNGTSAHAPPMQSGPSALVELDVATPESWPLSDERLHQVIARAIAAALAVAADDGAEVEHDGVPPLVEVLLTDDEEIRRLNARWRGREAPTNVLSFPAGDVPFVPEVPRPLGALVLSGDTLQREAGARGVSLSEHLAWLVIHGILHLLGYDHEHDEAQAEHMEALERAALAHLGMSDPYAETGA